MLYFHCTFSILHKWMHNKLILSVFVPKCVVWWWCPTFWKLSSQCTDCRVTNVPSNRFHIYMGLSLNRDQQWYWYLQCDNVWYNAGFVASFIIIKFFICLFQIENCPIFKYLSSLQIFLRVANLFPESSRGVGARQQSPVPAKHHTGEAPSGRRDNSDQVRS